MASSVVASPSTLGPISTPKTSSRTTSGSNRRGTRPASSGATTAHSAIQNRDTAGSGVPMAEL